MPRCGASEAGRNGAAQLLVAEQRQNMAAPPPVPRIWAHVVVKSAIDFYVIVGAQRGRGRLDGFQALSTPGKRALAFFPLELVSQSVHRACVRAAHARLRRCARVGRVALVLPHEATAPWRSHGGGAAGLACGACIHTMEAPRLRRRRRCARVRGRRGAASDVAARGAAAVWTSSAAPRFGGHYY